MNEGCGRERRNRWRKKKQKEGGGGKIEIGGQRGRSLMTKAKRLRL